MDLCLLSIFLLGLLSLNWSSEAAITAWTSPRNITTASGSMNATAIAENQAVGARLFIATATGASNYTLKGDAGGKGTINSTTGVVTLAKGQSIDYETTPSLQFVVVATASGGANGTATVTLPIADVKGVPVFPSATTTTCIDDNSAAGTILGTYTATDPDTGNVIKYSIVSGKPNTDFAINTTTGVITVATGKALAKATTATYTLVVNAVDNAKPPLTGTTTVSVTVGDCSGTAAVTALMSLLFASLIATVL